MKEENKNKILVAIACVLAVIAILFRVSGNNEVANVIDDYSDKIVNEIQLQDVVVTDEIIESANETIEATLKDEELETIETEEVTIEDEKLLESDAIIEQENISYDGTNTGDGLSLLGAYQGLTYYSQIDNRWKNDLYTSTNNRSQTIGSSGCGSTSASMVVSSSKGAILPTTMSKLFVENGYRTANNGTAWSAYPFIADYFDFNEYHSTSNFNTAMEYLKQKNNNGTSKYYEIVSCGSGLFTNSGHYIVLVALDGETIQVADPYLYSGKFNTPSRKVGNVSINGNYAYLSKDSFKKYANAKNYWVFSNDEGDGTTISLFKEGQKVIVNIPVGIACYQGNYALVDDLQGTSTSQFWIHRSVITDDSRIYALADVCYANGNSYILQIFDNQFWTKESNMKEFIYVNDIQTVITNKLANTVGQTKKINKCNMYSNSNLTGNIYTYKANTTITILENVSNSVDKIKVNSTGRVAYIDKKYYK